MAPVPIPPLSPWRGDERELWVRIEAHSFEPDGVALTFAARLARDHGWSLAAARLAIEEYRRFCFLAVTVPGEVTPSEEVDEVWHLHLTYSRDYWDCWCREVLRRPLHHGPTAGGPAEAARFAKQYAWTLARYEEAFGPPNPAFWPGTAKRFGSARFIVADRDHVLVVPLPQAILALVRRGAGAVRRVGGFGRSRR